VTWSKGSGWSAWQIAGRYDVLNLSDTAFNDAGGCLTPRSASIRDRRHSGFDRPVRRRGNRRHAWFLNDYTVKFNYTGRTSAVTRRHSGRNNDLPCWHKVSGFDDATVRGFGMRAHVDW
jgi:hypothetical protein